MKKIICYGDSNTFGYNPENSGRYGSNVRWTGVLADILGEEFLVKEEGCNNRTAFFENSDGLMQSGPHYLPVCLEKHRSFDIFVLALGTNNLQFVFELSDELVINGLKYLIDIVRNFNQNAEIIVIPPLVLPKTVVSGTFGYQFDEKSIKTSIWIQDLYKKFVKDENCILCDSDGLIIPSDIDGLHFSKEYHAKIAQQVAKCILSADKLANSKS